MPFTAVCPYCPASVNLPQRALGASVCCPKCGSYFTAVPPEGSPAAAINGHGGSLRVAEGAPPTAGSAAVEGTLEHEPIAGAARLSRRRRRSGPVLMSQPAPMSSEAPATQEAPVLTSQVSALPPEAPPAHPIARQPLTPLPESTPPQPMPWWINGWGLGALVLTGLALMCPAIAALAGWLAVVRYLTIPFAVLGSLACLAGYLASIDDRKTKDTVWLWLGGILSVGVLGTAIFWPSWLNPRWGMDFVVDGPDPSSMLIVTADNRQVVKELGRSEWIDADRRSVRQGDVHIRIGSVKVDVPTVKGVKNTAAHRSLLIEVVVANAGQLRLIQYKGLQTGINPPILRDPQGTSYSLGNLSSIKQATLGPAREIKEVLSFEPAAANSSSLQLEIPAAAWGGEGTCRFRIPQTMIVLAPSKGRQ